MAGSPVAERTLVHNVVPKVVSREDKIAAAKDRIAMLALTFGDDIIAEAFKQRGGN